ncbi:hypothetical protein RclHR1_17900002 [Rhizophagus clarus]|uniref:Uncharacterized protein n=1 Tax=Rhizophagus clarus TaxID=94130 RepID=A0A2Z6QL72_9GLOM|nr:hypothetical protein RclHR1_17900002 [Rhizophagus clarus]
MDFSKKFNYCLYSICHNLLARLKKSKPLLTNQSKTPKSIVVKKRKIKHQVQIKSSDYDDGYKVEEIGVNKINKVGETDKVEETDELEQIDDIEETDEIEETDKVKEIDEIEKIDEVEEIDEIEFERGSTTNKDKAQILEYKNLEIVDVDVVDDLDDLEIEELDENDVLDKISFKLVIKREDELVLHNDYYLKHSERLILLCKSNAMSFCTIA